MHPKMNADLIKDNWFKFDNYKDLEKATGYTRGSIFRKARELGLPEWNKRVAVLYSTATGVGEC